MENMSFWEHEANFNILYSSFFHDFVEILPELIFTIVFPYTNGH